ncbi:MAG: hypothetical protein IPK56_08075 [Elusimicrobia bacterium]|nr:hypothetical protein [Elusimicrobiota bacterium]
MPPAADSPRLSSISPRSTLALWAGALALTLLPATAGAVPPPDFIFRLGLSFFTLAGSLSVVLAAALVAPLRRMWARWRGRSMAGRKAAFLAAGVLVILAGGGVTHRFHQRRELNRWMAASSVWDQLAEYSLEGGEGRSPWLEGLRRRPMDAGPVYPAADVVGGSTVSTRTSDIAPEDLLRKSTASWRLLDVREDVERSVGYVPGSVHARMGDLLNGGWHELDRAVDHYVFCDEGLRARYSVLFLLSRGFRATAVRGGGRAWRRAGGPWVRTGRVPREFFDRRFRRMLSTEDARRALGRGAVMADVRTRDKIARFPLPGAVAVSYRYTPRADIEPMLARVPAGRPVVAACDTRHSCRDAMLVGVELEKRGHRFLGLYGCPWEMIDGLPFTGTDTTRR